MGSLESGIWFHTDELAHLYLNCGSECMFLTVLIENHAELRPWMHVEPSTIICQWWWWGERRVSMSSVIDSSLMCLLQCLEKPFSTHVQCHHVHYSVSLLISLLSCVLLIVRWQVKWMKLSVIIIHLMVFLPSVAFSIWLSTKSPHLCFFFFLNYSIR